MAVNYVVYSTNTGSATARPILRWGQAASSAEAAVQAINANEAVREVTTLPAPTSVYGTFTINTTTWAISSETIIGAAGGAFRTPAQIEDLKNERKGQIRQALRDSEWSQLPDAALTTGQKAEWLAYRDYLRAMYSTSCDIGSDSCAEALPPKPTTPEFIAEFD